MLTTDHFVDIENSDSGIKARCKALICAKLYRVSEDDIWNEVQIYRKRLQMQKSKRVVPIREILKTFGWSKVEKSEYDSPAEFLVATELKNCKIEFSYHKRIGKYETDFFFPQANLVIEIDGPTYHENERQREKDTERDMNLIGKGYSVIRIRSNIVFRDLEGCMDRILMLVENRSKSWK